MFQQQQPAGLKMKYSGNYNSTHTHTFWNIIFPKNGDDNLEDNDCTSQHEWTIRILDKLMAHTHPPPYSGSVCQLTVMYKMSLIFSGHSPLHMETDSYPSCKLQICRQREAAILQLSPCSYIQRHTLLSRQHRIAQFKCPFSGWSSVLIYLAIHFMEE